MTDGTDRLDERQTRQHIDGQFNRLHIGIDTFRTAID